MKLASCIVVCACALVSRVVEAFVPVGLARGFAGSVSARRAAASSPAASSSRQHGFISQTSAFAGSPLTATTTSPCSRYVSGRPSTTTMGFFGLGAPEIAVCLAVAALILGPDKLAGVAKDVGKMAGELKDVPAEFQAGIEEGEAALNETKALKSKPVDVAVDAEEVPEKETEAAA